MKHRTWMRDAALALVALLAASCWGWAAPQPQNPAPASVSPQEQYDALVAATSEDALDQFAASYPKSILLPRLYRARYIAYSSQQQYPQTLTYLDKLLALGDQVDSGMRLEAFLARTQGYFAGCSDDSLRTPDANRQARDAALAAARELQRWEKPTNMAEADFAAQKQNLESLFGTVAALAGSALANSQIDFCKSYSRNPAPIALTSEPDPEKFNRIIQELREEEHQSPRVR